MDLENLNKGRKVRRKPSLELGSMVFGRVPPQAKELEDAVLGAILLQTNAFDLAREIINAQSFYSEANQRIFKAMEDLVVKNMPIDLFTVVEQLKANEDLDMAGGAYAIAKLTNSVVSSANTEAHARIVAQKFLQREVIRIAGEAIHDAYEDSTDAFELLDSVDAKLSKIINGSAQKLTTGITSALVKSIQRLEDLRLKDSHITGVTSGFPLIDHITHGWQQTDLIILAARPSVGKTAFAGNLVINAAKEFSRASVKKSVIFFSLEMSTGQLVNRMLSAESGILLDKISNGTVSDQEMDYLYKNTVDTLSNLPLFIDDSAALNMYQLRSKCRQLKNKHNLGMVVIDYLQLMSGINESKHGNREQEISKISRDLKALAKELEVPVIALSQLSREPEKRSGENKMPQLSDLRESGAIEQDADMVMFLYRPEYHQINSNELGESTKGETHVKIAKHRNGSLDLIKFRANLATQKFTEMDGFESQSNVSREGSWRPVRIGDRFQDNETPF
jgi:replicative DNA helicase